jgi:ribosomal protein L4
MRNQAPASSTGVVTQKIAPALQAFQTKYNMISALASTIDAFMGQYTSPEEAPIAKALCKQVTEALTSTLSPYQGTTPRTTTNASDSESSHQSWADVARAPKNSAPLARGGARTYPVTIAQKNVPHNNRPTDQRILITTPAEARLARPSGYAIRQAICQAVPDITLANVPKATATKTGWAITTASLEIQSRLMEDENRQLMMQAVAGDSARLPTVWTNYAVQGLASALTALDGTPINVTTELIKEEVVAQTQKEPISCRPSRHGPGANRLTTWIISFTEKSPHSSSIPGLQLGRYNVPF